MMRNVWTMALDVVTLIALVTGFLAMVGVVLSAMLAFGSNMVTALAAAGTVAYVAWDATTPQETA